LRHKCEDADTKPFGKPRGWLLDAERNGTAYRPASGVAPPDGRGKSGGPEEEDPHLTDTGNARRLVAAHGEDLHYCHPWKSWVVWDGCRWLVDDSGEPMRRAKATVLDLFAWTVRE
jgi:putative DNA primase/helicase